MNISHKQRKLITSLKLKKYRDSNHLFVAEGTKVIEEFLNEGLKLHQLFSTSKTLFVNYKPQIISESELQKVSNLSSPNKVLALFEMPKIKPITKKGLLLALDTVNDPGNLGTIIRLCDWFGVETLLCSEDTVDCYNPKVVQASMGSLARVDIRYVNLFSEINRINLPIFIADMNGENIYKSQLPKDGVLVMGNEANGVSDTLKEIAHKTISIPRFGKTQKIESLNVATATSILLSEFRRTTITQMQN